MAKHKIQKTSLLAYYDLLTKIEGRQREVYFKLREMKSANNTMLSNELNLPINSIVPRIFELRKMGLVIYHKKELCPFTKKKTMFWKCRREL